LELKELIQATLRKDRKNLITFLTGAGISADSGIPTYRGSDGIWVKGTKYHKPEEFGTFKYFMNNPEEVWQFNLFRKKLFGNAMPNINHFEIAEIENLLKEKAFVITQNIDGLHLRAGNKNIYEIHGNLREIKCSNNCKGILPLPNIIKGKDLSEDLSTSEIENLKCVNCGKWMRPNILWFDEYYDELTNKKFSSLNIGKNSSILFVTGTSGATNLPLQIVANTLKYGGYVIDLNIEDNHFTELLKGKKRVITIRDDIKNVLPKIKNTIKDCLQDIL
jgi:NAD-dependent deacetylase